MNNKRQITNVLTFNIIDKELEQKLARQEEATGVAMVMQTQLTKYRELQKENEKLKEDNHYYRYN